MWPIASRVFGWRYDETVILKKGIKMKTSLDDQLGRMIIFYGPKQDYFWEPKTARLMELLLQNAKEAIIAGSHLGYLVLMARQAMDKNNGRVHAFEPVEYLYNISRTNFEMNKQLGQMIISKQALSNENSEAYIYVDNIRSSLLENKTGKKEKVQTITIDSYVQSANIPKLDFVLLDIEGYEYQALQGMTNILKRGDSADIIFEVSPEIRDAVSETNKICRFLESYGYYAYIIDDNYKASCRVKNNNIKIYKWQKALINFSEQKYFNVLASKKDIGELQKLGVEIK